MVDQRVAAAGPPRWRRAAVFQQLGPGLVTGAADDDPSGIATYSQAGAQFGYNMLWTMPLTYPLMSAVQLVSAQIGRVTGKGLAKNIGDSFPHSAFDLEHLCLRGGLEALRPACVRRQNR